MTALTPADELRAAAARMRTLAKDATEGPWEYDEYNDEIRSAENYESVFSVGVARVADLHHVIAWHPDVALTLADWLEQTAERHDEDTGGQHFKLCRSGHWDTTSRPGSRSWVPDLCPDMLAALAVARAFMGGGETG